MINTYSESQLHKTLKNLYANEFNGKVEQKINGKICDILTEENRIIEIQTGNLSQLKNKIETLTPEYKMTIVYPLAIIKRIETRSKTGTVISNKKSPKKLNLFHNQNISISFKRKSNIRNIRNRNNRNQNKNR